MYSIRGIYAYIWIDGVMNMMNLWAHVYEIFKSYDDILIAFRRLIRLNMNFWTQ